MPTSYIDFYLNKAFGINRTVLPVTRTIDLTKFTLRLNGNSGHPMSEVITMSGDN